jgi:hypothetical protein
MDITEAYESVWKFAPPRKCREMQASGLFHLRTPREQILNIGIFEVYDAATIAEGDVRPRSWPSSCARS